MRDFQTLTLTGEQDGVIADHITTANSGKADRFTLTRAGMTFATIDRYFLQIAIQGAGDHFTHAQRSA
ncbi:hypothetical protein D3C78_1947890 [compost metagenome]